MKLNKILKDDWQIEGNDLDIFMKENKELLDRTFVLTIPEYIVTKSNSANQNEYVVYSAFSERKEFIQLPELDYDGIFLTNDIANQDEYLYLSKHSFQTLLQKIKLNGESLFEDYVSVEKNCYIASELSRFPYQKKTGIYAIARRYKSQNCIYVFISSKSQRDFLNNLSNLIECHYNNQIYGISSDFNWMITQFENQVYFQNKKYAEQLQNEFQIKENLNIFFHYEWSYTCDCGININSYIELSNARFLTYHYTHKNYTSNNEYNFEQIVDSLYQSLNLYLENLLKTKSMTVVFTEQYYKNLCSKLDLEKYIGKKRLRYHHSLCSINYGEEVSFFSIFTWIHQVIKEEKENIHPVRYNPLMNLLKDYLFEITKEI